MKRSSATAPIAAIVSAVALGVGLAGAQEASASTDPGPARSEAGGSRAPNTAGVASPESGAIPSRHRGSVPRKAIRKAERRAQRRWRNRRITVTDSLRSKRDRRWALVNGGAATGSRPGLWSAWLKRRHGRWHVVRFADHPGADPPGVPCDISPAYSEPRC